MKKLAVVASITLVVSWGASAEAAHGTFVEEGTIQLANPLSPFALNVTEIAGLCDPDSPAQDLDGHWIDLPAGFGGHTATLTPGDPTTNLDAYFYDADCGWIENTSMAVTGAGEVESAPIPSATAHVIVNLVVSGGPGSFTFTAS